LKNQEWLTAFLGNDGLLSSRFVRWQVLYQRLFDSRWTVIALLGLGVFRVIFYLLAFPPADGADGLIYYLYAAFIAGENLPPELARVSPIFPIVVFLNHYILGNFDLLILWQGLMSASLGILMYLALRPYNALLGFLVALVVIADAQVGITFNFTATEPYYIFLLVLIYTLSVGGGTPAITITWRWQDVLLGVLLQIIRETRTVGQYIFVPVLVLFAIQTRDWRRLSLVILSFTLTSIIFWGSTNTNEIQQTASDNEKMFARPLLNADLLDPSAGPASEELSRLLDECRRDDEPALACLNTRLGSEDAANTLLENAYQETLSTNLLATLQPSIIAFDNVWASISGRAYPCHRAM